MVRRYAFLPIDLCQLFESGSQFFLEILWLSRNNLVIFCQKPGGKLFGLFAANRFCKRQAFGCQQVITGGRKPENRNQAKFLPVRDDCVIVNGKLQLSVDTVRINTDLVAIGFIFA